jgi:hypothetical protein
VPEAGWAGVKNGELLALAENPAFQVSPTIDRGMEYQENLAARSISFVFISSPSNRLAGFLPQVPAILRVLVSLEPGQLVKLGRGVNS